MSPIVLLLVANIIFSSQFLAPCLGDQQPKDFTSCLTYHNINNFTTPSDANYHQALHSSLQNLRFSESSVPKPKAIIIPSTKEQLVNTVLCCKTESLEIRVRSGGHSYEGTSSVSNELPFVIIEMKNLDKISVDIERETAWIEGGATLGQTYLKISEASDIHTITAGTCPTVGVGGQISGGGFGYLSRKYGLAADHVTDALLVDAEGRILDRRAMGEDVFWAIRGGGGGIWGIIYAYKMKLVTVPKLVTGFVVSRSGTKGDVATILHKWQFVAPKLEKDFYIIAFLMADGDHVTINFQGTYLGPTRNVLSKLESVFPELHIMAQDCKEMSWIETMLDVSGIQSGRVSDLGNRYFGNKIYFKGKYDYLRTHIPVNGIMTMLDILEKQPKGFVYFEPLGGFMNEIANDSIPFPHRNGTIFGILYEVHWNEEDNGKSKEYIEWVREIYDTMTPFVPSPRASYVNVIDLDLGISSGSNDDEVEMARVWGEKYFSHNYDRLVRAKTQIDPNHIFRNQQGIPPLSNSATDQVVESKVVNRNEIHEEL